MVTTSGREELLTEGVCSCGSFLRYPLGRIVQHAHQKDDVFVDVHCFFIGWS
jgi:hypothetical protein